MEFVIRTADGPWPSERQVEVVERKGLGHPDTICDAIAEQVSAHLCRHYLERFGRILHHNVDKVLLVGGSAQVHCGGGDVTAPIEIYLAGRATFDYRGERMPIDDLAVAACADWLRAHLPALNVARDVRIVSRLRPGSASLTALFGRALVAPRSNDTSCGVGFAPLTPLERIVLNVERRLTDPGEAREPAIGQDVKVMGVRNGQRVHLTIACAFVSRHVRDADEYLTLKSRVLELALAEARRQASFDVFGVVNAGDDAEHGDMFLTVTGTSAESGDDGEVGRGNRGSGLITPYRPMTMEAMAGKNPVSHVGKLYNAIASQIASVLVAEVSEVLAVECVLVSDIGRLVSDPRIVDLRVSMTNANERAIRRRLEDVVKKTLNSLPDLRDRFVAQRITVS